VGPLPEARLIAPYTGVVNTHPAIKIGKRTGKIRFMLVPHIYTKARGKLQKWQRINCYIGITTEGVVLILLVDLIDVSQGIVSRFHTCIIFTTSVGAILIFIRYNRNHLNHHARSVIAAYTLILSTFFIARIANRPSYFNPTLNLAVYNTTNIGFAHIGFFDDPIGIGMPHKQTIGCFFGTPRVSEVMPMADSRAGYLVLPIYIIKRIQIFVKQGAYVL